MLNQLAQSGGWRHIHKVIQLDTHKVEKHF